MRVEALFTAFRASMWQGATGATLSILLLAGCAITHMDSDTARYLETLPGRQDTELMSNYRVGPEDVLEIRVWGDEALSKTVIVRPDGLIGLPLIGDVAVAGRSSAEIAQLVEAKLKEYKAVPRVDVSIAEINSYRIYLLGEVERPGMVQVRNYTTVLQGIALVGGPTRFASNEILVLRKEGDAGVERVLYLDYRVLISRKAKHRPFNLVLLPGDTVIVK